jgi:hypothetical protein
MQKILKYKWLGSLALYLYIGIFVLFLAYFVFLNNSAFILYSFIAFVFLGILISKSSRHVAVCIGFSMALIFGSSISYFGVPILQYAAVALVAYAVYAFLLMRNHTENIIVLIAVLLPLLLYISGAATVPDFVINIGIIGYYLLISSVIALFIRTFYESNGLHKSRHIKRLFLFLSSNKPAIVAISTIIAVIILAGPVWPSPQISYIYTNRPYSIYRQNSTIENISVYFAKPPYIMHPICGPGTNGTVSMAIESRNTTEIFLMNSSSSYSDALSQFPYGSNLYGYSIAFSTFSFTNATISGIVHLNTSMPGSCIYATFLSSNPSNVSINADFRFVKKIVLNNFTRSTSYSSGLGNRTEFLPGSLSYLSRLYLNETFGTPFNASG